MATDLLLATSTQWPLLFARVSQASEYQAKNRNRNGAAIGIGFDRALPGIYWATYFGSMYLDFIGRDKVFAAPADRVEPLGKGAVIYLAESPHHWKRPQYRKTERRVRAHLGREFFYDRKHPTRQTKAPDFGLPPLPVLPKALQRGLEPGPVPAALQDASYWGVVSIVLGVIAGVLACALPLFLGRIVGIVAFALGLAGLLKSLITRETYMGAAVMGMIISGLVLLAAYGLPWHMGH